VGLSPLSLKIINVYKIVLRNSEGKKEFGEHVLNRNIRGFILNK
jgi:hypothetical protein